MRAPVLVFVPAVMLSLGTAVVPVHGFDLTGHWVGKYSCKGFAAPYTDDGKLVNKFTVSRNPSTLDINQNGSTFGAIIDLGNGTYRYNAFAMESVKNADVGEVFFIGCSTAPVPPNSNTGAEIVRAQVKTKAGTLKATFKGVSIFADNFPEVETCKYSYKRVDAQPAGNVGTCQ